MELPEEIALVTGASRGIGKAIAQRLGKAGATVIGTATSIEGANSITHYLKEQEINGVGIMLNVTNVASIEQAFGELQKDFSMPTILVNNAGITRDNLFLRMKEDEWDDIINTNLTSVYRLAKACIRHMVKARKGRVINIASIVGVLGNIGQTNYAAAKAGVIGFGKALAREVAVRGITVNTVAPGFIDTAMTQGLADEQKKMLLQQIPLNRLGQVEDVANAVAFLASPQASYITGQTLHVNGGMYMS